MKQAFLYMPGCPAVLATRGVDAGLQLCIIKTKENNLGTTINAASYQEKKNPHKNEQCSLEWILQCTSMCLLHSQLFKLLVHTNTIIAMRLDEMDCGE